MNELEEKFVLMILSANFQGKQCFLDGKLFFSCDAMMRTIIKRKIDLPDLEIVQCDEKVFSLRVKKAQE